MMLRLDREDSLQVPQRLNKVTFGDIYIDGVYECCTLEDEVRELLGVEVSTWKVPGATAIPASHDRVYDITSRNSRRFGPGTLTIEPVPGFTDIRIHGGTTIDNTEGCVLVGSRQDRQKMTIHGAAISQQFGNVTVSPVLDALKGKVHEVLNRGERLYIQIRNSPGWYKEAGIEFPKEAQ